MKKFLKIGYWAIFIFYIFLLVNTVFLARDARRSVNLIPFDMIQAQGFTINVYGNILMFVPLGIYVLCFMKKPRFLKALFIVISTSVAIEGLQYVFERGATDIDDVILNTAGGLIGICLYSILRLLFKKRVHNAIAILSLIVGIPVISITLLITFAN